jgi:outer membrane protein assembly factor BamB
VAVAEGKVFVGQLDAKLTALDQKTGAVAWSVQVDDPRAGYSETMAPVYYDGLVYIGASGAEYEIRGHFSAYYRLSSIVDRLEGSASGSTPAWKHRPYACVLGNPVRVPLTA